MSKMIGKSGVDWSKAPEGATYVRSDTEAYYKINRDGDIFMVNHHGAVLSSFRSVEHLTSYCNCELISKEEDLEMTKEVKQVRSVEDLEVGMFVWSGSYKYVVLEVNSNRFDVANVGSSGEVFRNQSFNWVESWSYTYNGEYTQVIKETEAERKIKELEETVKSATQTLELAQKQLQEYKEMKR